MKKINHKLSWQSKTKSLVNKVSVAFIILFIFFPSIALADLFEYVNKHEEAYQWEDVSQLEFNNNVIGNKLKLTSQVWQGITWQHTLRIIKPDELKNPTLVFLLITGSGKGKEELAYGTLISSAIGAPVAILHDVPYQPLFGGIKEDNLIAYTFVKFKETNDDTWPLLLPMVKSAVKAMDAIQEFIKSEFNTEVSGFVVAGGSKRGWTTWLSAAVDDRVKAIAPMVYDNLNLTEQMKHQLEAWGKYSEQISEYTERNLPQILASGEDVGKKLESIVDPFAYREKITVPKLMVIGTNDRYWPLDALNIYYDELVGEKYILYVPNAGHGVNDITRVIGDAVAFFLKAEGSLSFPNLSWKFEENDKDVKLGVTSDITPESVKAWVASSSTRDFRDAKWEKFKMTQENGSYIYKQERPTEGYAALFGEAIYFENGKKFFLSTNVNIFNLNQ